MNKTKEAISNFVSKAGHHDTTVHGTVAPSVQHETIKPTQHENINTAVDKETHQDHYHTTVQPVHDKEVLPEQHHHNVGAVEHREFDHRNHDDTKRALATENQKFKDERVVHDATRTESHAPVVQGEHVHHHVHETIQPVVHKETVQPHVVHTTIPVHEVHHNAAQHHSTSALPAVNMADFKKSGGVLGGQKERVDSFEGGPDNIPGIASSGRLSNSTQHDVPGSHHGDLADGGKGHHHVTGNTSSANHSNNDHLSSRQGVGNTSSVNHSNNDHLSSQQERKPVTGEAASHQKSSGGILNKLNPMTDSNGDGKAGFMK